VVENRLIYLNEQERKLLCILEKVVINGHTLREIIISEAHSLLTYLGPFKTYAYLWDHIWWKALSTDVQKYCKSCMICKRSKPSNQKPYGLLNPLDVPSHPWESIGIDFLGPLPATSIMAYLVILSLIAMSCLPVISGTHYMICLVLN
jgi:hypothetical protein